MTPEQIALAYVCDTITDKLDDYIAELEDFLDDLKSQRSEYHRVRVQFLGERPPGEASKSLAELLENKHQESF